MLRNVSDDYSSSESSEPGSLRLAATIAASPLMSTPSPCKQRVVPTVAVSFSSSSSSTNNNKATNPPAVAAAAATGKQQLQQGHKMPQRPIYNESDEAPTSDEFSRSLEDDEEEEEDDDDEDDEDGNNTSGGSRPASMTTTPPPPPTTKTTTALAANGSVRKSAKCQLNLFVSSIELLTLNGTV